jgi:hypothetical protein
MGGGKLNVIEAAGLIERDADGRLDLTDRGLAALRAVLPEL